MKYYVTKYALTAGILIVDEKDAEVAEGYLYYGCYRTQVAKKDWFISAEEAKKRAEELREKKIKSLKRQLDNLRDAVIAFQKAH